MALNFLESEFTPASPDTAAFYIIPCPLEKSVSWGRGTALGPRAILEASQQLESLESGMSVGQAGFYTTPAIDTSGPSAEVIARVEKTVNLALRHHAIPVLLGGEHTASLGALKALADASRKSGRPFGVVQFDAHADLRAEYHGDRYSHASVMRMAVEDLGLPLVQLAVREISPEEVEVREKYGVTHYDASFLARVGLPEKPLPEDFPHDIYITFDVDAFDPSLMPATGTPSPGGINWREAHFILEAVIRQHKVIGLDVMELAPIPGLHHADYTAARLTHLLMALAWESEKQG